MQVQTVHGVRPHDVDPTVGHRELTAGQVKLQRRREQFHVPRETAFDKLKVMAAGARQAEGVPA